MKNVAKWATGKPLIISILAPVAAHASGDCTMLFSLVKSSEWKLFRSCKPSTRVWNQLYRSSRQVFKVSVNAFHRSGNNNTSVGECLNQLRSSINTVRGMTQVQIKEILSSLTSEELKQALAEGRELAYNLRSIMDDFSETDPPALDSGAVDPFSLPEVIFIMRVFVPCLMLFGTAPGMLLRKARDGDRDSILKLARLDQGILNDPFVHEHIEASRFEDSNLFRRALADARKQGLGDLEPTEARMKIASLLEGISEPCSHRLKAPDIQSLFDAAAKDSRSGLRDTFLAVSPGAFYQSLYRQRTFWEFRKALQKKPSSV